MRFSLSAGCDMYTFKATEEFEKQFKRLDRSVQILIRKWLQKHLLHCEDPRALGKGLTGNLKNRWRYRIANYRLLALIKDDELIILALEIEHRSEVYQRR